MVLVEEELNHLSISTVIFFQRQCVIVKSQKRYVTFSPKELQMEQDDAVESLKSCEKSFVKIKNVV